MYQLYKGFIPKTNAGTYNHGCGKWADSSAGDWLDFLKVDYFSNGVPVDPVNIRGTCEAGQHVNSYTYKYYCYPATAVEPLPGLSLLMKSEKTGSIIYKALRDKSFTCL